MSLGLAVGLAVLAAALLELLKDELRGQIERIPVGLLLLARARVPADLRRSLYDAEWLPELHHILEGSERLPLTCLVRGTGYALGLVRSARTIARELGPVRAQPPGGGEGRGVRVGVKLVIGAVAIAFSFVTGFGLFGALGGAVVSLIGGLVVIVIVDTITRDLHEVGREQVPWT
jgi:hypothetical protein